MHHGLLLQQLSTKFQLLLSFRSRAVFISLSIFELFMLFIEKITSTVFISLCHDARSGRQTYPFFVKDQHWSRSYVIIFCERPRCLVCHPEILMQNLIYFRSYRSFSVKNIILDFNKKIGTGKRLFHNFTPLHL